MLYDPLRHEGLIAVAWDEARVRGCIRYIVENTELRFSSERYWPVHAHDLDAGDDPDQCSTSLYFGACGVIWALRHLQETGFVQLSRSYLNCLDDLLVKNRAWLASFGSSDTAAYMMGDTPILMLAYGTEPTEVRAGRLAALIEGNLDHPARELMWGSPGTLLASLFLHEHTGDERWAELFRLTAARLWSQREWSPEYLCHYWSQDLYGSHASVGLRN
jgi:hypothetical protein